MMNRVPPQAQTYGFPTAAGLSLPGQQQHQQQPGRAMALPQPSPNKGTLVPGQVLRVGKIQVTVERYLSEGLSLCCLHRISVARGCAGRASSLTSLAPLCSPGLCCQAASRTSTSSTLSSHCRVAGRMFSSASPSEIENSLMKSDARLRSWCVFGAAQRGLGNTTCERSKPSCRAYFQPCDAAREKSQEMAIAM